VWDVLGLLQPGREAHIRTSINGKGIRSAPWSALEWENGGRGRVKLTQQNIGKG
jgi:hypothetical protein